MRNGEARRMSELTTEAQRGDLAVRASESNVYAGEIDVLSVRSSVRKGQGSVRECKAESRQGCRRSQGNDFVGDAARYHVGCRLKTCGTADYKSAPLRAARTECAPYLVCLKSGHPSGGFAKGKRRSSFFA
jgi:hypothetical protein